MYRFGLFLASLKTLEASSGLYSEILRDEEVRLMTERETLEGATTECNAVLIEAQSSSVFFQRDVAMKVGRIKQELCRTDPRAVVYKLRQASALPRLRTSEERLALSQQERLNQEADYQKVEEFAKRIEEKMSERHLVDARQIASLIGYQLGRLQTAMRRIQFGEPRVVVDLINDTLYPVPQHEITEELTRLVEAAKVAVGDDRTTAYRALADRLAAGLQFPPSISDERAAVYRSHFADELMVVV